MNVSMTQTGMAYVWETTEQTRTLEGRQEEYNNL